jgi:hypothetical protein
MEYDSRKGRLTRNAEEKPVPSPPQPDGRALTRLRPERQAAMLRECTRCRRPFTPPDLARDESRNMESERKAAGLQGVRFLYYHCPACGINDIFVDILPRAEESDDDFQRRRKEMEEVVRHLHSDQTEAVVVPVPRR